MPGDSSRADWYDDDPDYDYRTYWLGRDYEHGAEQLAIRRLLRDTHVGHAVDVGGGFGRHSRLLARYADAVTLVEPSSHQLNSAAEFLRGSTIERRLGTAANLRLPAGSADLILMARVMHHLPEPQPVFTEFARVLRPGGILLLEFANSAHIVNRMRSVLRGRAVPRQPIRPVRCGEQHWAIPFVNHHPQVVITQLCDAGFDCQTALSVSNLRSALVKRALPLPLMLSLERVLQPRLAAIRFGPSIWLHLCRR